MEINTAHTISENSEFIDIWKKTTLEKYINSLCFVI